MWELATGGQVCAGVQSQVQMRTQRVGGNSTECVRRSALVAVGRNREHAVTAAGGRTAGVCLIEMRCSGVSWLCCFMSGLAPW